MTAHRRSAAIYVGFRHGRIVAPQAEGKWRQLGGSAREQWGKLTDDDQQTLTGQKDQLVGKIQVRYGIAKAEVEKQVDAWPTNLKAS